ncbi:hypothetical protein EPN95_03475 [Patescibacteria group bacterium]|nr:MAG: hypothetical protein EPN95_03475 [Patescibacteria group bacterium]
MNEFVAQPTQETQDYIGAYVDRRATDPAAAAEEFPAIEQRLEEARRFKEKMALGALGKQGVRYGF